MWLWTENRLAWLKAGAAGFMAGLLLLLGVSAASERLHSCLHANSSAPQGACAVCSVAKGQVDTPVAALCAQAVSLSLVWTLPALKSASFASFTYPTALGRGPPAFVASC